MQAEWFFLSVIPKAPGFPVVSMVWAPVGWIYMTWAQMQLLRESLACCADTFAAYSLMRRDGTEVAAMNCQAR